MSDRAQDREAEEEAGGEGATALGPLGPALVLTATELSVLEDAHLGGLAQTSAPDLTAGERTVDAGPSQARWSLVARGLLTTEGRLPEDTALGLLLQTLLDVRLAAEVLVVVERLVGDGRRDVRLLHLVRQGGVVEDVHPEGLHGLDLLLGRERLVAAVIEMVVPADATGGDGTQVTADLADVADGPGVADPFGLLPALLHHPTVLAELTMVRPQHEATGHLVALGPHGCWAGPTPAGRAPLRLSPVEPEWVGELVTSWVQGVVGVPEGGTMSG